MKETCFIVLLKNMHYHNSHLNMIFKSESDVVLDSEINMFYSIV